MLTLPRYEVLASAGFSNRHGRRSTIITSQLPVKVWYDVIGEKTLADAILDRLVHDANRVDIDGDSMRRNKKLRNL